MAQLINRLAQAAAEQEAMSRRGGFRGNNRSMFSTDQADEFGRTSIFSKSPEKNPGFDPYGSEGMPYKENTKAGKRLNLRELQNRIAEAEGFRMLQKQHELGILQANNASGNRINEGREATKDEIKKLSDLKTIERVAETEALMRLGKARNPNASPEQALLEGTRVQNTTNMALEDRRQAEAPHLPGLAGSKANVTNRENDSKDSKYFQDKNAAELAGMRSKATSQIGSGGMLDHNNPNGPDIYSPSSTKIVNSETDATVDAEGNLIPGSKTQTLLQNDPRKVDAAPKINLSKYSNPGEVPDLGSGNSAKASAGGNTSTQTTASNPTPQIPQINNPGPMQGSWTDMFNRNNNTLEGSVGSSSSALPKAPVIPSLQAPVIQPPALGSMEPSNSFSNPFEAPKANPFGIPSPQQNWDPNFKVPETIPAPAAPGIERDPVTGYPVNMGQTAPKAPNHMIPQIGNPLPQGAKPQSQLNVPDILNLIRSMMSKPQTPAPMGLNRPGF